jgi:hypothetical protein
MHPLVRPKKSENVGQKRETKGGKKARKRKRRETNSFLF